MGNNGGRLAQWSKLKNIWTGKKKLINSFPVKCSQFGAKIEKKTKAKSNNFWGGLRGFFFLSGRAGQELSFLHWGLITKVAWKAFKIGL